MTVAGPPATQEGLHCSVVVFDPGLWVVSRPLGKSSYPRCSVWLWDGKLDGPKRGGSLTLGFVSTIFCLSEESDQVPAERGGTVRTAWGMESVGRTKASVCLSLELGERFSCWASCQVLLDGTSSSPPSGPMGQDLLSEAILCKKNRGSERSKHGEPHRC